MDQRTNTTRSFTHHQISDSQIQYQKLTYVQTELGTRKTKVKSKYFTIR